MEEGLIAEGALESVPYLPVESYEEEKVIDERPSWMMPKMEKREQAMRICGAKLTKWIIETCGLVVPVNMKPVKIVDKRAPVLVGKRAQQSSKPCFVKIN